MLEEDGAGEVRSSSDFSNMVSLRGPGPPVSSPPEFSQKIALLLPTFAPDFE